jgi:hypothetical protein
MSIGKVCKRMIVAGVLASAAIIYFLCDPLQCSFYPSCPLRCLTGLKCPLCGLQAMIHHLLHGQVRAAFVDNPLLVALIPYFCFYFYLRAGGRRRCPRLYKTLDGDAGLLALLIVGVAFAVFRNIFL